MYNDRIFEYWLYEVQWFYDDTDYDHHNGHDTCNDLNDDNECSNYKDYNDYNLQCYIASHMS